MIWSQLQKNQPQEDPPVNQASSVSGKHDSFDKGSEGSESQNTIKEGMTDNFQNNTRTDSSTRSPPRSPGKTRAQFETGDENTSSPEDDLNRQPVVKKQSDGDKVSPKFNITVEDQKEQSDSGFDSDLEDYDKPRQRNDKVVFSPKGANEEGGELSFTTLASIQRKEKSQSIVNPVFPKEYEELPRTFTELAAKQPDSSSVIVQGNVEGNKSVNTNTGLKFLDKAQWTDDLKCYVCSRVFNKMDGVFTHHCRACGKSVCGDCSTKKINDSRACDVCIYKATNVEAEERRRNFLREKTRMIKEYKKKLEESQKYLEELSQKKVELEKQVYEEREEQDRAFLVLQKEKMKVQEGLEKKRSNNKKLKDTLDAEQKVLREREKATNEIKEVLTTIRIDLAEKKGNISSKQEEAERLSYKRQLHENAFYSCVDMNNNGSFLRSPDVVGSCIPNIPGSDGNKKEESSEGGSMNKIEE